MLHQRFASARLSNPYMMRSNVSPFNRDVRHRGFCPKELTAVWSLLLPDGSEGSTFIFRTARRFRVFLTQGRLKGGRSGLSILEVKPAPPWGRVVDGSRFR